MKKLVCDRCGFKLEDRNDIKLVLEGREAWETACRARGAIPRGIFLCKNYIRCGGEIKAVISRSQRLMKFLLMR